MNRSDIKELIPGITDAQLDKVMHINGIDIERAKEATASKFEGYVKPDETKGSKQRKDPEDEPKRKGKEEGKPDGEKKDDETAKEIEELRKFKAATEAKAVNDQKTAKILAALDGAKVHPKAKALLLKQFDLSKVELDDKGNVKDLDKHIAPIKDEYKEFFGSEVKDGYKPGGSGGQEGDTGSSSEKTVSLRDAIDAESAKK
jgi:hypothetical protein